MERQAAESSDGRRQAVKTGREVGGAQAPSAVNVTPAEVTDCRDWR